MSHSTGDSTADRVLILAPSGRDSALVARGLAGSYTEVCADAEDLLARLEAGAGVALVAEEALSEQAVQRLGELLRRQPSWSDVPLVVLTGSGEAPPAGLAILRALEPTANIMLLERPVRAVTMLSAVRAALRARRRQYEVRDHLAEREAVEAARARLLAAEQAARAEVEAANRAKDEFLAILSHELRTPLQSMLGWVRLLKLGTLDPDTVARALETLERSTHVQTQFIADLLDVSRIVVGKLWMDRRPLQLRPVLEAALDSIRAPAQEKGVHLDVAFAETPVVVAGDAERLQQVVWNLLSNAVKFTPPAGRVSLRLERRDRTALITVRDTGPGITAEMLPHVFDRFRQADSTTTRPFGGLGLGLAIVRHLVEAHDGVVRAQSAGVGRGTTFHVTLPMLSEVAPPAPGGMRGRWAPPER
jgi:signal transduction histidine kinase